MAQATAPEVRLHVYRRFLEDGSPPSVADVADALGISSDAAEAAFRELEAGRVLVFEPGTLDIWMANPLCARSTGFRVSTAMPLLPPLTRPPASRSSSASRAASSPRWRRSPISPFLPGTGGTTSAIP